MKKFLSSYILLVLCLILIMSGCQKGEEKHSKESPENNSPPNSLEDLQKLSEDVLTSVNKKEWNSSLSQIKSVHSKWNDFFAEAEKKGISVEKTEKFNKDLNTLTNLIISKAMEENKDKAALKYKKAELELENEIGYKKSSDENNDSSEEEPDSKSQGNKSEKEEDTKQDLKLPEEVLPDSYPLMTSSPSELEIAHAAVNLTKHIPYMAELFNAKVPSEILILKYQLRDIKISSKQGKWGLVDKSLAEFDEIWPKFQPKIIEKKDSLAIQFNQSILELKEVVKQKDSALTTIKSDIALENIKKMIEIFE